MNKYFFATIVVIVLLAVFLSKLNNLDIKKSTPNSGSTTTSTNIGDRPYIQRKDITFTINGPEYKGDGEEKFFLAGKDKDLTGKIIRPGGSTMNQVGTIEIDGQEREVWRCHATSGTCIRGFCHTGLPLQYLYVRKNTDSYTMDIYLAEKYFTDPPSPNADGLSFLTYDDIKTTTTIENIPDLIPVANLKIDLTAFIDGKETNYALSKDAGNNPVKQNFAKELIAAYFDTNPIAKDVQVQDIGTISVYRFNGDSDSNAVYGLNSSSSLIDGQGHDFYVFNKIVAVGSGGKTQNVTKNSLQLNWFTFVKKAIVSSTGYGWWIPDCKPAIYLYPKEKTQVSVQVVPKGFLSLTIPQYPSSGWNVVADPDGTVHLSEKTYPYLYYEAKIEDSAIEKPTNGYVVAFDELTSFYDSVLPKLGLNNSELKAFRDYWKKALPKAPYYFVGIMSQRATDAIEPLTILPKPDTIIRVRLYFEALQSRVVVDEPKLNQSPVRNGFTVVEWGGMVKRDKEHPFTCSQ